MCSINYMRGCPVHFSTPPMEWTVTVCARHTHLSPVDAWIQGGMYEEVLSCTCREVPLKSWKVNLHNVYDICITRTILMERSGQGEVVSCPPSALIFCAGWKMLLQESNHSLGTGRLQLLPTVQLTIFDISEPWPKSVSDTENALI